MPPDPAEATTPTASSSATGRFQRGLPPPSRALGLIIVVVLAYGAILMISSLRTVLVMLLVSLFVSFAVEPAVKWLVQHRWRRGAATAFVFITTFLLLLGSFGSIIPVLVDQVGELLRSLPRSVSDVNGLLSRIPLVDVELDPNGDLNQELLRLGREFGSGDLASVATGNVLGAAGSVVGLGATAIGILFQGLTVLLVSFYMVADGPKFRAALARPLPPHRQRELLAIWEIAVAKTGGYIYSRLLLAMTAAVVTSVALTIIGVPYPIPLGLWVGVSGAFIPVVGTYLGGVLVLLVAIGERPIAALWVLVFFVVYQQLENYLIAPRLTAVTMDVHPALAFISVIIGATLLGAVGALLALPATAIIKAVASTYLHRHELIDELIEASESLDHAVGKELPPLQVPGLDDQAAAPAE